MKIGQLSEVARTQVETIRFYEREGLLAEPKRTAGNYRIYDQTHLDRLLFIRHCRALDMTLDEIRVLLRFLDCWRHLNSDPPCRSNIDPGRIAEFGISNCG